MFLKGWNNNKTIVDRMARDLLWKVWLAWMLLFFELVLKVRMEALFAWLPLKLQVCCLLQEQVRRGRLFWVDWIRKRIQSHIVWFLLSAAGLGDAVHSTGSSEPSAEVRGELWEVCSWNHAELINISSYLHLYILISLFQYYFLIFILGQDQSCVSYYWCN